MSRGLAAFVAGMGGGYLKGQQQSLENERQDKLDKMREEEFSMRKAQNAQQDEIYQAGRTEREEKAAVKNAMAQSNQAGQIEDVATANYTDASGQQKSAYQPDAATAKVALEQQAMEEGKPMPGMEGNTASVGAATSVKRMDGSRALYTGFDGAAKAKAYADENQPGSYAAYSSLEKRLRALPGGEEAADKTLLRAKLADKEGVFRAMTLAQNGDFAEAKKSYNSSGMRRLTDSQELQFGADGKTVQVFDKGSGQILLPDVNQKLIAYLGGAEGAVAQAKARADAVAKYEEKLLEPYTLKPGEKRQVFDRTTGKTVTIGEGAIPKGYELVTDQSGNTLLRAMDPRGSGAGSAGGSSKATDPRKVIGDALDYIGKNSTLKDQPPDVVAKVQQYTYQVVTNSKGAIPAEMAATIAIDAGLNPNKLQTRLDPSSGTIDQVYETPQTGQVTFQRGYASAMQPNGVAAEQMKGFANQIVQAQPSAIKDKLVSAAFDTSGEARRALETGIKSEINAAYDKQLKDNPGAKAQIEAARVALTNSTMESLGRKLDLVSNHYPKPKTDEAKGSTLVDRLAKTVGLRPSTEVQNPNKYAGMTRPQMDAADAQAARDWREKNPRPKVDPQMAATAKAQLAELEQQRTNLLRQGKSVDANAVTEKMRSLKSQYGV